MIVEPSYTYRGKVLRVVDGDTLDLSIDLGFRMTTTQRVRLAGVDTPEMHAKDPQERRFAVTARNMTVEALEGRDVVVETSKSDDFGRWLAVVYVDGSSYNETLAGTRLATRWPTRWREVYGSGASPAV